MKTLYIPERDKLASADRIAFVVCGYHGDDGEEKFSVPRRIARRLRLNAIHDNDSRVMNFYANPRSLSYLMALIDEFQETNQIRHPAQFYIDEKLGTPDATTAASRSGARSFSVSRLEQLRGDLRGGGYGSVVVAYADAIGLGCHPIESVARAVTDTVVIVNGRRRAFALDAPMRRALWWRRTLSRWRIDWILALVFLPMAAFFAVKDSFAQGKYG